MPVYRGQQQKTRADKLAQAFAQTRLGGWLYITVMPAIDRRLMRWSRGKLVSAPGQPILLLNTIGAKSGQPRATPLLYTPDGSNYVIVASKAGAKTHPAWFHNLKAHSDNVSVEIRGERIPVRPRILEGEEREQAWALVNDNYNGYETYQGRAGARVIPVVRLEPEAAAQNR